MEAEQSESLIDLLFKLLEQFILPNWSDLFGLLPWVLIGLIAVFAVYMTLAWRRTGARNRPRVTPQLSGGSPPPGVHLPGPSRWPFVAPIGAGLLLFAFALPTRDAGGNTILPFNLLLFLVGLVVTVVAITGWLREAMREWRATAQGERTPAVSSAVVAVEEATTMELQTVDEEAYPEPPPGVHLPGPSPWPFFAPIAMAVILLGVIFSSVLIVGGLILGIIAAVGWYLDAGHEYRSTEEVGHAVPLTRDPVEAWPRRLVPVFAGVIVISVLIALAPLGHTWLNSLTPPEASPTAIAVPAVPEISASSIVSFDTNLLIVPAARPFELVFNNNQAGVPHNVDIADSAARNTIYFDGEVITGVATITYQVPALDPGDYYFLCKIHPNMNGTVKAILEAGQASPAP